VEPVGERVIVSPTRAKRLAHGADEHASVARRRNGRSGSRRLGGRRKRNKEGSKGDRHQRLKRWRPLPAGE
jgi:hypothetical protein